MDTRKILHDLVDRLREEDLITAIRLLKGLLLTDELTITLENTPEEVMRQFRD